MRTPQRRCQIGLGKRSPPAPRVVQNERRGIAESAATIRNFARRFSGLFMMFSVDADCDIAQGTSE